MTHAIKERPILFSAPMVRAVLDARLWKQLPEVLCDAGC